MTVGSSSAASAAAAAASASAVRSSHSARGAYPQRIPGGNNNYCPAKILIHSVRSTIDCARLWEIEEMGNGGIIPKNNPQFTVRPNLTFKIFIAYFRALSFGFMHARSKVCYALCRGIALEEKIIK